MSEIKYSNTRETLQRIHDRYPEVITNRAALLIPDDNLRYSATFYRSFFETEGLGTIVIPKTINLVWLTHTDTAYDVFKTRYLRPKKQWPKLDDLKEQMAAWPDSKFIVTTNAPQEFSQYLEDELGPDTNVVVQQLDSNLRLYDKINILHQKGYMGLAIDLLKYSLIYQHGGVVIDFNFIPGKLPDYLFDRYNFLVCDTLENSFIASSKEGAMLDAILMRFEVTLENIDSELLHAYTAGFSSIHTNSLWHSFKSDIQSFSQVLPGENAIIPCAKNNIQILHSDNNLQEYDLASKDDLYTNKLVGIDGHETSWQF